MSVTSQIAVTPRRLKKEGHRDFDVKLIVAAPLPMAWLLITELKSNFPTAKRVKATSLKRLVSIRNTWSPYARMICSSKLGLVWVAFHAQLLFLQPASVR